MASSATPWRTSASRAPANRGSVTLWLKRARTMPIRSPSPFGLACRWRGTGARLGRTLEPGEQVAELRLLRAKVPDVTGPRLGLERRTGHDIDAVALEAADLLGVVGEEPDAVDTQVAQDLRADPVVPQILAEAELQVRLDGVPALVLERVGADLVRQPDPPALLMEIDEDAATGRGDQGERLLELIPAIAALGAEHVARQALGVEADEHLGVSPHVAQDERHVLVPIDAVVVDDRAEARPGPDRQLRFRHSLHEGVRPEPHVDHLRDPDTRKAVRPGERCELRRRRQIARGAEDRTDHRGGAQAGESSEVARRLRQPSVDERTARRRLDRRHVAGHNEIGWLGIRRDRREHRG